MAERINKRKKGRINRTNEIKKERNRKKRERKKRGIKQQRRKVRKKNKVRCKFLNCIS